MSDLVRHQIALALELGRRQADAIGYEMLARDIARLIEKYGLERRQPEQKLHESFKKIFSDG